MEKNKSEYENNSYFLEYKFLYNIYALLFVIDIIYESRVNFDSFDFSNYVDLILG